jgi:hypothetical protein
MANVPFVPPRYVNEEEKVIVPYPTPEKPRQGAWCKVAVAAGYHARVVNEELGIDRWLHIDQMLVPPDDPRA